MVKKRHTRKSLIVKGANNKIIFISKLHDGTSHDYDILKTEFPPISNCFENVTLNVDLGFQGIKKDYKALKITIPFKRKRVKKGESNELSPQELAYNKVASSERVDIEHSITEMKVCRIIHQVVRIKKISILNDLVLVTAGLANFKNSK